MAESLVQVTEGSGKKLHTWQRTIGANAVEDEVILHGEPYLATYVIAPVASVSLATANDHIFQVMAGSSLHVLVRRIRLYQTVAATTANYDQFSLLRLTTAGTGGTALTPAPLDTSDSAAGCTAMTTPTAKGSESTQVGRMAAILEQTAPTAGASVVLAEWDFEKLRGKALRIPSGTANGIALKNITASAGAQVQFEIIVSELNFT
jgi:hypothetical protein